MSNQIHAVLTNGVIWTSVTTWINKVIGIAYVMVVLSSLSVYEYGLTELIISIPALLSFMGLPGLESVLVADMSSEIGRNKIKYAKHLFTSYLSVRLILALIAWAVLFISSFIIATVYSDQIALMIQIVSFTFLLGVLRSAYQTLFRVSLRFDLHSSHRVIEEISKLVTVIVCIFLLDLGPVAIVIGYICTDLVALPVMLPSFIKVWNKVLGNSAKSSGWGDPLFVIRGHGKWGIVGVYLGILGQNIRPWIIKMCLGTHAVGLYAAAMGMFQNTSSLVPVTQVVAPIIPQYVNNKSALNRLINCSIKYQLFANIFSSMAMVIIMPVLIKYLFPSYYESYWLFACMLVALIPLSFSGVIESTFFALKAQRSLFYANIVFIVSIVSVLPVALLSVGLYGVAVELLVTRTAYSVGRYLKLTQLLPHYKLNARDLFSVSEYDKLLIERLLKFIRIS